jgi:hypothetical protein
METSDSENEIDDVHAFPVVSEDTPAQYLTGKKGNPLLVDPFNYVYVKMKDKKAKTYWRCQREVSKLFPR